MYMHAYMLLDMGHMRYEARQAMLNALMMLDR